MKTLIVLIMIASLMLVASKCFSQVVYNGTPEQRKTGIYESVIIVKTDAESGMKKVVEDFQDQDIKITSCVELNDGDCIESEYFKATIKDVKG